MKKIELINLRMNAGMLINLDGNEISKKPYRNPNTFDEYIQWISDDFFEGNNHAIYTDKMFLENSKKYIECSNIVWGNSENDFDNRTPNEIDITVPRDKRVRGKKSYA